MKRFHKTILAAGLLASLGLGAIAQTAAPQPPMGGQQFAHRGEHGRMDPARMQEMRARMEKRMQERLDFFKFQLKITPAQEGAWNAWTAAMKPGQPMARPERGEFERLSTPERIDRMRALRATRQAEMDKRMDATKAFYASLNTDQKKVFDEHSLRFLGGHRGGHRGGFGGHGEHGHRG